MHVIEEDMFFEHRNLFSGLELVFFDTISIYFEGAGGQSIGKRGNSKDHRPDLPQMVVGVIIDDHGKPVCCEMWPGNTTDVKTLIPIVDRLRKRFGINRFLKIGLYITSWTRPLEVMCFVAFRRWYLGKSLTVVLIKPGIVLSGLM